MVDARAAGAEQQCSPGGPSALIGMESGMKDHHDGRNGSIALAALTPDPRYGDVILRTWEAATGKTAERAGMADADAA